MVDIDNDGDAVMNAQSPTDREQIMQHMTSIGQEMATAVQQGTNTLIARLSDVIGDARNAPQNRRSLPPPPPDHGPSIVVLKVQNETLNGELQESKAKRLSLEEEVARQEKNAKELEVALHKSRAETKHLNTIIIKGGVPNNGPSDDQVRIKFCKIRDNILKLVRWYYQAPTVSLRRPHRDPTTEQERQGRWLGHWTHYSTELRNYRVQGAIFEIIHKQFFASPFFGVENELEQKLRLFEVEIERSHEISKADLVDWRRRTVSASKFLESSNEAVQRASERASKKIRDTLEPALTPLGRSKVDQLFRDILAICCKALELSLELRQSKAIFKVVVPDHGLDIVSDDAQMELVAMNGGMSSAYTKVAFTVFGGLEKTTLFPGENEETVVLEKSNVVGVGYLKDSIGYS